MSHRGQRGQGRDRRISESASYWTDAFDCAARILIDHGGSLEAALIHGQAARDRAGLGLGLNRSDDDERTYMRYGRLWKRETGSPADREMIPILINFYVDIVMALPDSRHDEGLRISGLADQVEAWLATRSNERS